MQRGLLSLGRRISFPTLPETNSASICWRCQAAQMSSRSRKLKLPAMSKRHFSSSPARLAEATKSETYYDFFHKSIPQGPPPQGSFKIDPRRLRQEFLELQAASHPDRHPENMRLRAEALSARINEAYKTLLDPLLRTQYLLSLRGIDIAEDETAKVEDQDLLMEVLESQEEIESAENEKDLKALQMTNDERLNDCIHNIARAFTEDDLDTVKTEAVRLRYWTNIREGIKAWEPGKEVRLVH